MASESDPEGAANDRRFSRQVLLPEVGVAGQMRLLASCVGGVDGDPGAAAVTRSYLARAGVSFDGEASVPGVSTERVDALAARPELRAAAEAVAGAYAAVEHIKRCVGAGTEGRWPDGLRLTGPPETAEHEP